jgi:oligoendopeptidase F
MNLKLIGKLLIMATLLYLPQNRIIAQESGKLPTHDQIEPKYTWNLKDIYESDNMWENDFKWVQDNISNYQKFEGKLGSSAESLLKGLKFDDEMSIKLGKLFLYAMLSKDLDLSNSPNLARFDRISQLGSEAAAASAFIRPEILDIPISKIDQFMEESKDLKVYKHQFDNLFRMKEHTLPKEEEELLAQAGPALQIPDNTFGIFTNADLQFPTVKDPQGNDIQISIGRYRAAMYSTDRGYRERVYKGFYKPYMTYKNTLASLFSGEIKTQMFTSKARKYNSCREAALNVNNIPVSVYDNLVKTVDENLEPLHRWARLKKKILGLKELHHYDVYVTLFPAVKKEYSYDKAEEIVKDALKPLGEDYIKNLTKAFNNRWVDVYETKGKRSGAYSSGTTYGVHPYVLLNWNNQLDDVFTLAHEMGHNMHSFYTGQNQPFPYADYSIFVAEVASTCNEALLLDYLIQKADTKEEKLALIEKYLTNITTTFYRQTMFAEFEELTHEKMENGEALTAESLAPLYKEIVQKYWGPDMVVDDEEAYTWSWIPHFYYNFYVYQYATSYAASQIISEKIKNEKQPEIDKYLNFLKSGNSDYPINTLKKAGVDMSSPEPIKQTINKMNELLDEMEKLLAEK